MKLSKTISELVQISENTCALEEQSLDITVPAFDEGIPIDTDDSGPSKTALIAVHYGGYNEIRKNATTRAVQEWDSQQIKPDDGIFIELTYPGESPCFSQSDFPKWIRYMRIYGKERNRNLFQKEALWNLATKYTDADKLLFLDSDISPIRTMHYFQQMKEALVNGISIQACHCLIHEKYEDNPSIGNMYGIMSMKECPSGHVRFTGIGYGITRHDFHERDGFQPFSIPGSGDMIFICESFPDIGFQFKNAIRYHQSLVRKCPRLKHDALDATCQHNFHGNKEDRAYCWSREAVLCFGLPQAYCHVDSSGLIAWNDPDFILKEIVMQKKRMHTKQETYDLICEIVKKRLDLQEKDHAAKSRTKWKRKRP